MKIADIVKAIRRCYAFAEHEMFMSFISLIHTAIEINAR